MSPEEYEQALVEIITRVVGDRDCFVSVVPLGDLSETTQPYEQAIHRVNERFRRRTA